MTIPLDKLSADFEGTLDRARLFTEERGHASIAPQHLLFIMLNEETAMTACLIRAGISIAPVLADLTARLNRLPKSTLVPGRRPVASRGLRDLIERSFEEMEARGAETVESVDFIQAIAEHGEEIAKELRAAGITRKTLTAAQNQSDSTREFLGSAEAADGS